MPQGGARWRSCPSCDGHLGHEKFCDLLFVQTPVKQYRGRVAARQDPQVRSLSEGDEQSALMPGIGTQSCGRNPAQHSEVRGGDHLTEPPVQHRR